MKVVRCESQNRGGDGNNTQTAKNRIYDAFAAILGKGKAKSKEKEKMEVKKGGSSLSFENQVINQRQSEYQDQQQMNFSDNIEICLPWECLEKQKDKISKQIHKQIKYTLQKLSKLPQKPLKGEITCKKSGKPITKEALPMNFSEQEDNLWFQDEQINQQFISSPFDENHQINKKAQHKKQLRQCQFVVEVIQDKSESQLIQKKVKKVKNDSNIVKKVSRQFEDEQNADNYETNDDVLKVKAHQSSKTALRQVEFIVFFEYNKLQQQQPKKTATCKKSGKGPLPNATTKGRLQYQAQNTPVQPPQNNKPQFSQLKLGRANLQQLVSQLQKKQLISQKLAQQFFENHSDSSIKAYIQLFNKGKLQKFNFSLIKITILDHRRIAQLLMSLYPGQYDIGSISSHDETLLDFLLKEYAMTGQQYYRLYDQIDRISKIKWWGKILVVNEEKMMRINKEKRVAERRAKRAEKAVEEVLKECRENKAYDVVEIQDDAEHQGEDKGPTKMVKLNE